MDKPVVRILHVVGGMNQGGTENFLMNVYRNIDKSKIQFDFLVNREGYFDDEIKKMGGKIYYISALQKVGQLIYKYKLDKFLKNHKEYKIIHSHLNQVTGIILERAKKYNIPVRIAHSHNSSSKKNLIVRCYKSYLGKKTLKNATHFFACSDMAAKWMFKEKAQETIIIKNGIEVDKFAYSEEKRKKARKELNISDSCKVIGNVARFEEQKNHLFLIDIFYEYQNKNPDSCLLLIGTGSLEKNIKNKVEKLNIQDKVIFLGIRKDTDYMYCAMDYFVFPSLYEGLGIVLIEAQASGLKCLTSNKVVPEEAKITDNLEYIDLTQSACYWAEKINTNYSRDRKEKNSKIEEYNIINIIEKLTDFYLKSIN